MKNLTKLAAAGMLTAAMAAAPLAQAEARDFHGHDGWNNRQTERHWDNRGDNRGWDNRGGWERHEDHHSDRSSALLLGLFGGLMAAAVVDAATTPHYHYVQPAPAYVVQPRVAYAQPVYPVYAYGY